METDFGRNITGRVDVFVNGAPPTPANTVDLVAAAAKSRYWEDQAAEFRYADSDFTIKLTPPDFQHLAFAQAATTGLLLFRLDASGKSRPRNLAFEPGTYHFFLNLVDGRWLGRAIGGGGVVICSTLGILVRQQVNYHPGRTHTETPSISLHRVFEAVDAPQQAGRSLRLQAESGWADVQIDWTPFGAGCWKTIVCVPGPDQ